jgi:outer membrane protein assembly factor BamB
MSVAATAPGLNVSTKRIRWPLMSSSAVAPQTVTISRAGAANLKWSVKSCPWWLEWRGEGDVLWLTVKHCGWHSGKVRLQSDAGKAEIHVSSAVLPGPLHALTGVGRGLAAVGIVGAWVAIVLGVAAALGVFTFLGSVYTVPLLPLSALIPIIIFSLLLLGPIAILLAKWWGIVMGNLSLLGRSFVGILVATVFTVPALVLFGQFFSDFAWADATKVFAVLTVTSVIGIGMFALFTGGWRIMLVAMALVLVLSGITFFATESIWLPLFTPPPEIQSLSDRAQREQASAQAFFWLLSVPFMVSYLVKMLFSALFYVQFIFTLALPFLSMLLVPVKSRNVPVSVVSRPGMALAGFASVFAVTLGGLGLLGWQVRQSLPAPEAMTRPVVMPTNTVAITPVKPEPTPWSAPAGSFHLEVAWTRALKNRSTMRPVVGQNRTLYVAADDTLVALSEDGSEQWQFQTDGSIRFPPCVLPEGDVYIYSTAKRLTVLTPTGAVKWNRKLDVNVARNPLVAPDGSVYACVKAAADPDRARSGRDDYALIALSPENTTNWQVQLPGLVVGPLASPDGRLIYVGDAKTLRAINAHGSVQWEFDAGSAIGRLRVGENGTAFVVAGTHLIAVSPEGTKQWEFQPVVKFLITDIVVQSDSRVLCRSGGSLYAVDHAGKLLWRSNFEGTLITSSQSGKVYGVHDQWLYILSSDGAQEWKVTVETNANMTTALGHGDQIYVLSSIGNLEALRMP